MHRESGGRVTNEHHDHGKGRKVEALKKHDRLKNNEEEDTAYRGSGDGEHEELFARGGTIRGREYDHSGGAKDKHEVLRRHDRLKNETGEPVASVSLLWAAAALTAKANIAPVVTMRNFSMSVLLSLTHPPPLRMGGVTSG